MATLNTRHFSKPSALRSIAPEHLLQLLRLDAAYFELHEYPLPENASELDIQTISDILNDPAGMTSKMQEAMFEINELSRPDEDLYDLIFDLIKDKPWAEGCGDDASQADLAVLIYLNDPDIIEEIHAQNYLSKPKSFYYYRTSGKKKAFQLPDADAHKELTRKLNFEFKERNRGKKSARVTILEEPDKGIVNFLVRRGDPVSRQAMIDEKGESGSVFYRPEQYDLLVYDSELGELRMTAKTQWLSKLYRAVFGEYCFGDVDFFQEVCRYDFSPLRNGKNSILHFEFPEIERIKLTEIFLHHKEGPSGHIEVRRGKDLFQSFESQDMAFPEGEIERASFSIKLKGIRNQRTLKIGEGNKESVGNDQYRSLFEKWMLARGFIFANESDCGSENE